MSIITDLYKGDTVYHDLVDITDYNGDIIDLSGKKVYVTFKLNIGDTDDAALLQQIFTVPNDADAQAGTYKIVLDSDNTKQLRTGKMFYDIRIVTEIPLLPDEVITVENGVSKIRENISDLGDVVYTPPIASVPVRNVTGSDIETLLDNHFGDLGWKTSGGFLSYVIVRDKADFGVIDSSKIYLLDGIIDMGSTSIEIPATGISISGLSFNVSKLVSNDDNYT